MTSRAVNEILGAYLIIIGIAGVVVSVAAAVGGFFLLRGKS